MKIGISLCGVSYGIRPSFMRRDFREVYPNFVDTVINPFLVDNQIRIYTTTYPHQYYDDLLRTYNPTKSQLIIPEGSTIASTYKKSLELLRGEDLDILICTRFDMWFNQSLGSLKVDLNKFNFLFREKGTWESQQFVTDNLYVFPFRYLDNFIKAVNDMITEDKYPYQVFMHHIYEYVVRNIGIENVYFIDGGLHNSKENQFYQLKRS
jgi:hypothetical protein